MKRTIPSLAASSPPTTTFSGPTGAVVVASSVSDTAPEFFVSYAVSEAVAHARVPPRHSSVADLIQEFSRDPGQRKAIEQGRRWVGKTFLADEGDTIRTLRLRKGWSQEQLASALRTSQSHVARIERGTENLSLDTCRRLCSALGIDMNSLDGALRRQEALRGKGGET